MLKVVLDTSVFVSAILSKNRETSPSIILNKWQQGSFSLVISPQLQEELILVLLRKGISSELIENLVIIIETLALKIEGVYQATILDKIDPKDNMFLAASYEAKADYLVSLDNHLLSLKFYHGTQILTPSLFLKVLET
ncbi:putative toxin-antitoxin system toxin component, PIN family [Crocosphaera sp. UHCC 0190]|uniref:putative toxin-antitoxin system toxin component, PIN family n=1 Tax=Crocosphaera sp. UHCC 0190 TaxID=3110246 RepID=UPI002B20ADAB|nr:putative toxin-antitoxin system toxin component, PIN family [Crocosphaera sp. UHCC 0190]MEA5511108.1 putative toxin-antitoxin system toxin component, PIN family [Crocosphaera sp. UHCC 0190]